MSSSERADIYCWGKKYEGKRRGKGVFTDIREDFNFQQIEV